MYSELCPLVDGIEVFPCGGSVWELRVCKEQLFNFFVPLAALIKVLGGKRSAYVAGVITPDFLSGLPGYPNGLFRSVSLEMIIVWS